MMIKTVPTATADVTVEHQGTVVLLILNTDAARGFVAEHVVTEQWQWLGSSALAFEARCAGDLIGGMVDGGLGVEL